MKTTLPAIRCDEALKKEFKAKAKKAGMTLSAWVLFKCSVDVYTNPPPKKPLKNVTDTKPPSGEMNGNKPFVCLLKHQ